MARGEVGLVRVRVADRRQDGDLLLSVERGQRLQRGVPVEPGVLGELGPGGGVERELRAQLPVRIVERGIQNREGVRAAREENGDEHGLRRPRGRLGDALLEEAELAQPVDGEREPERSRDERPPVEPGARGHRHPRLDRRQPAPGLGGGLADERGPGELVAVVAGVGHQQVWRSGEEASSWRSAFSTSAGYCSFFQEECASDSARFAKCFSSAWVCAVSEGSPRKASARRRSLLASYGSFALPLSRTCGRIA